MRGTRVRLGDVLLQGGALSADQLACALDRQQGSGSMLGEFLVEEGIISSTSLVQALATQLGVQGCTLRHGLIDPALLQLIGAPEAERLQVIPMFKIRDVLTVAMAEPQSLPTIDRLSEMTDCKIRPVLAMNSNILEYVHKYAGGDTDVDEFLATLAESDVSVVDKDIADDESAIDLARMVDGSPVINLVNVALLTAIKDGASDIHIEPCKRGTRVRYRMDGVLRELMNPPVGMHGSIVSRVKVIAKMDIAEKRLPQEGRVSIVAEGREIDLRVSSMPTLLGEKLVIRVLDQANLHVRMETLGFRSAALGSFQRMLSRSHGMVLVTGPTGSGKTTTLYSALDLLRNPATNIVTVEDPVEYQLDLINQVQVQSNIGMTFAAALRSILRQDPDVIMIGEIRDEETARVAVQAALTGHVVLATLHTNDAPSTVARLIDMNVESYLLSGALNGIIAQRLARTNCSGCSTKYYPDEQALRDAGLDGGRQRALKKGTGCQQCHNSGFRGRTGIYEVMELTSALQAMVHHAAPAHELRVEFQRGGGTTLHEEGMQIALEGKTSLEEALRVTRSNQSDSSGDPLSEPQATERSVAA